MARMPRIVVPGQALHIIQRGNNRQPVFFRREDYPIYLEALQQAAVSHGCAVHAYVLMTNHLEGMTQYRRLNPVSGTNDIYIRVNGL